MHIKSILAGVALALAATIGSASAADQFTTLDGVPAATMSAGEMAGVRGEGLHDLSVHTPNNVAQGVADVIGTTSSDFLNNPNLSVNPCGCKSPPQNPGLGGVSNGVIHFANHTG